MTVVKGAYVVSDVNATYTDLVLKILGQGEDRSDRTGTGTTSLFGEQIKLDVSQDFPLLTVKTVHWKSVAEELFWFLRGETNVRSLQEKGVTIWNEWADKYGRLGPVYGYQWRKWTDQIKQVEESIKTDPMSRRHIVSAWNVMDIPNMALPPCHTLFQFYCSNEGGLSLHLYMRSCDVFLGLPFNIASYALLLYLMAAKTNKIPDTLTISFGDVHLYHNHMNQVQELLGRPQYRYDEKPRLTVLTKDFDWSSLQMRDIQLDNYKPQGVIKAPIAV
jgi:thymidylate synthase